LVERKISIDRDDFAVVQNHVGGWFVTPPGTDKHQDEQNAESAAETQHKVYLVENIRRRYFT
jgi:hypothetical protein